MSEPVKIAMPPIKDDGPVVPHITFNNMAKGTKQAEISDIPNLSDFSKRLDAEGKPIMVQLAVKAPGTNFLIPPEYAQFAPTIQKMVDEHYSSNKPDSFFSLGIFQGVVEPHPHEKRPFIKGHRDIDTFLENIKKGDTVENVVSYLACDTLPTGFTDYDFTPEEIERIKNSENPRQMHNEILDGSDMSYKSGSPGKIIKFDRLANHAFANPAEATSRTVIILRPEESIEPENFNNTYLKAAVERQQEQLKFQRNNHQSLG